MTDWLTQNYVYFILCLEVITLIVTIITMCKKRVKVDNALTAVLSKLPDLINLAENTGLDGKTKFALVFSKAIKLLADTTGKDEDTCINSYGTDINLAIENILSTPTKKGENYENKTNEES